MTILDTKKLNKLWAKSTDLQNPLRERHMFDLAFFLWSNRQFEESVAVSGTLIDLLAERPGESLWIDAMHLQSMAFHDLKRDDEAIETELRSLAYAETLEPASERAFMHWHLADCYRTTEQPELQEAQYLKAIEAFIESENKFFLGQAYIDLANLHYGARRYDQSKQYFHLAIPVLQETSRTDRMPFVKYRLAGIERHLGNLNAALALAEEAVKLARFAKDVVAERENLIEVGLVQEALSNYQTALEIFESLIDDNDDSVKNRSAAKALYFKARILETLGEKIESSRCFSQAVPLLKVMNLDELSINAQLALIHQNTEKVITRD
jgi:tetratricopeptide (TPR) repeat protein